jgi:hypothetical protein
MRLENRRRLFAWTSITLVVLAAMAYANRTKLPASPNAFPSTLSGQCDGCRPEPGALLLASAQRLDYMDPVSGLLMPVLELGHSSFVDYPNLVGRDSLLVQVCHVVDGCTFRLLSLATGGDTIIARNVEYPAADTVTHSLYFYGERTERGTTLFVAPLADLAQRRRVARVEQDNSGPPMRPIDLQRAPIVLPAGRGVVFLGTGDTLTRYDVQSGQSHALPIVDCTPVLVRTTTGELLCVDVRIGSWYLLALETGRRTIVAEATNAHGAVCDEHADALYFGLSAMTLPERTDLYRVPLGVRARRERVAKGVYFSTGIWIPLPAGRSPLRRGT